MILLDQSALFHVPGSTVDVLPTVFIFKGAKITLKAVRAMVADRILFMISGKGTRCHLQRCFVTKCMSVMNLSEAATAKIDQCHFSDIITSMEPFHVYPKTTFIATGSRFVNCHKKTLVFSRCIAKFRDCVFIGNTTNLE